MPAYFKQLSDRQSSYCMHINFTFLHLLYNLSALKNIKVDYLVAVSLRKADLSFEIQIKRPVVYCRITSKSM